MRPRPAGRGDRPPQRKCAELCEFTQGQRGGSKRGLPTSRRANKKCSLTLSTAACSITIGAASSSRTLSAGRAFDIEKNAASRSVPPRRASPAAKLRHCAAARGWSVLDLRGAWRQNRRLRRTSGFVAVRGQRQHERQHLVDTTRERRRGSCRDPERRRGGRYISRRWRHGRRQSWRSEQRRRW